jgi:hypothetical protein
VKCFCNAKNVISYIQDIEIINVFHDGISDDKTVEEIAMKKPKTVIDLLVVADVCIEAFEARARLLESRARGPQRRRMIVRLTQLIEMITRIEGTADTVASDPQIKRRRGTFGVLMMQRSGAKFTTLWGMI